MSSARDALDSSQGVGDEDGAAAELAQTTTVNAYPTQASAFYAIIPCDVNGNESEGQAATYVQREDDQGNPIIQYALNLGSQAPPSGTTIICHAVGGRWTFRYDG
jgi:hypothetical protein